MKNRFCIMLALIFVISSCGASKQQQDITNAESAIRADMRESKSAEFRNATIRTIWAKDGSRKKIYCGELNGNNGFGGKSGFLPVSHLISAKFPKGDNGFLPNPPGTTSFYQMEEANYYLDCIRNDTERRNGTVFLLASDIYKSRLATRLEMEQAYPVLSMNMAPSDAE